MTTGTGSSGFDTFVLSKNSGKIIIRRVFTLSDGLDLPQKKKKKSDGLDTRCV